MGQRSQLSDSAAAASTEIDNVLFKLVASVKEFRCPSDLDFPSGNANALILLNTDKNKAFINQLRKLNELRTGLAKVSTHGDKQLEVKHRATNQAIGRALLKMKEYQLSLHAKLKYMYIGGVAHELTESFASSTPNLQPYGSTVYF
ncbi:hypothetical protein FRC11_005258 [Ceratobasidium sp. 423]|nr:hypothetical protein FRC11_005258 [Ceratobasidium sp. 423]